MNKTGVMCLKEMIINFMRHLTQLGLKTCLDILSLANFAKIKDAMDALYLIVQILLSRM